MIGNCLLVSTVRHCKWQIDQVHAFEYMFITFIHYILFNYFFPGLGYLNQDKNSSYIHSDTQDHILILEAPLARQDVPTVLLFHTSDSVMFSLADWLECDFRLVICLSMINKMLFPACLWLCESNFFT